jgi:hypothetical protein
VVIALSRWRLARAGTFILLAVLVVLLGAAAKHNLYDAKSESGYLGKAVKMDTARMDPHVQTERTQCVEVLAQAQSRTAGEPSINAAPAHTAVPPISFLSPPLLV